MGADIILQQHKQGTEKIRVGLLVDSKIPVREGCVISDDEDNIVGQVTSGSFSPSLGKPIVMALLKRDAINKLLYATVRTQKIAVSVTTLPFIPHRYQR